MAGTKKPTKKYNPARKQALRKSKEQLPTQPLTEEQKLKLSAPAHLSMKLLIEGKGTATDWHNVTYRVTAGLLLAKDHYNELELFELAVASADNIRERFVKEQIWSVTSEEEDSISTVLHCVDQMQGEIERVEQILAFRKAGLVMEQFRQK